LYLDKKNSFFVRILSQFAQSAEGAGEIIVPYGLLNDGLKPVPFVGFEISPPGYAILLFIEFI